MPAVDAVPKVEAVEQLVGDQAPVADLPGPLVVAGDGLGVLGPGGADLHDGDCGRGVAGIVGGLSLRGSGGAGMLR